VTQGDKPIAIPIFFARLGQRLIHILSAHTSAGVLYEADMRLRPDGASGMLVSNLSAFEKYQAEKAWLWEHQALVRARFVAGDPQIAGKFLQIRKNILSRQRERNQLQQEVRDMREKMRKELDKPPAGMFHLKQGSGGIVDIEFLVQFMMLAYSNDHPALLEWTDNIRILETLGKAGVMSEEESSALCDVYRNLRSRIHQLALQEEKAVVDDAEYAREREIVRQAWQKWLQA
jgi:glutamate-ammonia-ligase adenylyltransferase